MFKRVNNKKNFTITTVLIILIILFYLFFIKTVEISHPDYRTGEYYTKSSFAVFYEVKAGRGCSNCRKYDKKQRIVNSDPKTFEVLNKCYTKDKNNFYICSYSGYDIFRISTKCEKIENVDRDSFQVMDNDLYDNEYYEHYAKDKNHIYYYGKIIENADVETFKKLNYEYAIDKNNVYFENYKGFYIIDNLVVEEFLLEKELFYEEKLEKDLTLIVEPFINF